MILSTANPSLKAIAPWAKRRVHSGTEGFDLNPHIATGSVFLGRSIVHI